MKAYWTTLSHSGVCFPDPYQPKRLSVKVQGKQVQLSPLAEEMAYNLAKKKDTPYIQDPVFTANFMSDFVKQLPAWCRSAKYEDVDFSELFRRVDNEKAAKEAMGKGEKKAQAAARKERREQLKEKFGYAVIDGKKVEFANYLVEPPGLFMGRGCVEANTIVKTEHGPKYVSELAKGAIIAVHHGSDKMYYRPVAAAAPQGVRPVLLLRTRTHSIRATGNHPFLSLNVSKMRVRDSYGAFTSAKYPASLVWSPLSKLRMGDYVVTAKRYQTSGTRKYSNVPKRAFNNTIITPNMARLLGYYLGDGFTNKRQDGVNSHVAFSEGKPKLVQRYSEICRDVLGITPIVSKHSGGNSMVISLFSREFADIFDRLGVTGSALTKRVPGWVYDLADDLKCAFIRGYADADGNFFVKKISGVEYGSFGYESTNQRLIEDMRELAISAGLQVSNITSRDNHGYTKGVHYRFFISEFGSVSRLLDKGDVLMGDRTRRYSLSERSNELRNKWNWSHLHILDSKHFALEPVLEIKNEGKSMTFDVSIADKNHPNFIANGFVVHNSHPLRGKWKPRVDQRDVILNLDEATKVPGDWKEVVHDHASMWMAKWIDKLTEKEKYVWLHESSHIQQSRSKAKYDNAMKVGSNMKKIEARIEKELSSKDPKMRQISTVCYLIHELGMRVGDEKDEDEADTVGASTLRVEHVNVKGDKVEFDFLGKDSIPWKKTDRPPPQVLKNIEEFKKGKKPDTEIFHDVTSSMVNQFLSSIVPGLSAKVFRTYHATAKAKQSLESKSADGMDEIDKLYHAKEANLQAAIFCNHQRTLPKTWEQSYEKKKVKLEEVRARGKQNDKQLRKLEKEFDFYVRTKNYNLNTSLKNYIDPRVYKRWCDQVGLDWAKIYSKSLQRKFSWVAQSTRRPEPQANVVPEVAESRQRS